MKMMISKIKEFKLKKPALQVGFFYIE